MHFFYNQQESYRIMIFFCKNLLLQLHLKTIVLKNENDNRFFGYQVHLKRRCVGGTRNEGLSVAQISFLVQVFSQSASKLPHHDFFQ